MMNGFCSNTMSNFLGSLMAVLVISAIYGLTRRRYEQYWDKEKYYSRFWKKDTGKMRFFYTCFYFLDYIVMYIFWKGPSTLKEFYKDKK